MYNFQEVLTVFFLQLLDPGGGFISETAAQQF
jgi:hypothetical protein